MNRPEDFLSLIIREYSCEGEDLALCAGYERGVWRNDQLAEHIIEWLPEFALSYSEVEEIGHSNAVKMIKKAAKTVYKSEKYGKRGEFGEVLLHIAIRQIYNTLPAVSKIYYKSAVNETVKGFDAVHVVKNNNELELWIGETKFYSDLDKAIYDVTKEIVDHLETDYLRDEFILIGNKIDPKWPECENLKKLLSENTSLDNVFKRACIPVLLTYESDVVGSSVESNAKYLASISQEIKSAYVKFREKLLEKYKEKYLASFPITVHVILIPLKEKKLLVEILDTKLKALQL